MLELHRSKLSWVVYNVARREGEGRRQEIMKEEDGRPMGRICTKNMAKRSLRVDRMALRKGELEFARKEGTLVVVSLLGIMRTARERTHYVIVL